LRAINNALPSARNNLNASSFSRATVLAGVWTLLLLLSRVSLASRLRVMTAERVGRQKELRAFSVRDLRGIESRLRPMTPDCQLLLARPEQFCDEQVKGHKPRGEQDANSNLNHQDSFPNARGRIPQA
jgi:hypothetical protein